MDPIKQYDFPKLKVLVLMIFLVLKHEILLSRYNDTISLKILLELSIYEIVSVSCFVSLMMSIYVVQTSLPNFAIRV
jgi:hypothetical protein